MYLQSKQLVKRQDIQNISLLGNYKKRPFYSEMANTYLPYQGVSASFPAMPAQIWVTAIALSSKAALSGNF